MSTIFIFRRDFRLYDNRGFIHAAQHGNLLCIFILSDDQIGNKNKYKSDRAVQFMYESLKNLKLQLQQIGGDLHIFRGDDVDILNKIISKVEVDRVVSNLDFTPFARGRDNKIKQLCNKKRIIFTSVEDYTLHPLRDMLKSDGTPYVVFSAFRNNVLKLSKPTTKKLTTKPIFTKFTSDKFDFPISNNGGRTKGINLYKKKLNPSRLGPYIKFGCLSCRELYGHLGDKLIWRDFFYTLAYYRPESTIGTIYGLKDVKLTWDNNSRWINAWKNGKTGFPVVDAGMRELTSSGYISNRMRLIVSSFLRLLDVDWRIGERFFAVNLVDYDPILNNSNWQWIYSIGTDTKPAYQRLMNPWIQSKKIDISYIKKWVPEVSDKSSGEIHNWYKYCDDSYKPIISYKIQKLKNVRKYK